MVVSFWAVAVELFGAFSLTISHGRGSGPNGIFMVLCLVAHVASLTFLIEMKEAYLFASHHRPFSPYHMTCPTRFWLHSSTRSTLVTRNM